MIHDHLYPGGGGQEGVPVGPGCRDSRTQGQPGTGGGGGHSSPMSCSDTKKGNLRGMFIDTLLSTLNKNLNI